MGGNQILFGPLARKYLSNNNWTDMYPGWPQFADELDALLELVEAEEQLGRFLPRLETIRLRDSALAELRAANIFRHSGFRITQWEPPGNCGTCGEFSVARDGEPPIFVEVKSPGWESELTQVQIDAGRRDQPKYIPGIVEGGAVSLNDPIHRSIDKAYPKFRENCPNLLVIADDLRLSLQGRNGGDWAAHVALYDANGGYGKSGYFTSNKYERLGGVAFLNFDDLPVYYFRVYGNPYVLNACRLSPSILELKQGE